MSDGPDATKQVHHRRLPRRTLQRRGLSLYLTFGSFLLPAVCIVLTCVVLITDQNFKPSNWMKMAITAFGSIAFWSIGLFVIFPRSEPFLAGFSWREFKTLASWTLRGDPLGRRFGRTRCHRCDYERGSNLTCPECGSERIDPV